MDDIPSPPAGDAKALPDAHRDCLNALSLCTGIGGLDLGLERTGAIRVCGMAETDPWCRSVLAARWPGVPLHDDVRTLPEWWSSERPRPRIRLVCGGFPCQPHSAAGKRLGTADPRWLWPAVAAVIEAVAPPLVLIENVPRLVRSGLADVLGDLARLGFDAWWDRIPAAALGAPHLRWRLFLIAAHPGRATLRHEPWRGGGADGPGAALPGYDGALWSVADPGSFGQSGRPAGTTGKADQQGQGSRAETAGCNRVRGADVADPLRPGLENRRGQPGVNGEELPAADRDGDRRRAGPAEPGLGRSAHGPAAWLDGSWEDGIPRTVPRRGPGHVARLRAIGNAVVPAVGEHIGRVLLGCQPEFRDD